MQVILKGNEFQIVEMFREMGEALNPTHKQQIEKGEKDCQERWDCYLQRIEELEAQLLKAKETKEHAHLEAMKDVVRKGKAWAKVVKENDINDEFPGLVDPAHKLFIAIGNCPDVD